MKSSRLVRLYPLLAGLTAASNVTPQSPFDLDPAFRTEIDLRYVSSIVPLMDGRVVISGALHFPEDPWNEYSLARLFANGIRDASFYTSGLGGGVIVPWNSKYYVEGIQSVRRVLLDGTNDTSFAMGVGSIPYFSSLQGGDYHVFTDGRVLMSGYHTLDDTARGFVGGYNLIWFTNTGYLDTTRIHRWTDGVVYEIE
jgi:hypothetical protein